MTELIRVTENDRGERVVSARELHEFLWIKKHFTEWFNDQKGLFTEGVDYEAVHLKVNAGAGSTMRLDYALTLDTAKEMAMISRTERGKEARQYFIQCEKELRKPKSQIQVLLESVQILAAHEERLTSVEGKVVELEAKTTNRPEYYSISGYASLVKRSVGHEEAKYLGKEAANLCRQRGITPDKVSDAKYGQINTYPSSILKEVFAMALQKAS